MISPTWSSSQFTTVHFRLYFTVRFINCISSMRPTHSTHRRRVDVLIVVVVSFLFSDSAHKRHTHTHALRIAVCSEGQTYLRENRKDDDEDLNFFHSF